MPQHSRGRRHFSLRLLGQWQLVADGEDVALGHREQRLLALLGLLGQSSRPRLAGILWPGTTDSVALARLRRAALLTHRRCPGLLQLQPHRLTIGLAADVEVDVHALRRAAAATEHALTEGEAGALLRQLVGEQLLPDWYDDWVLPERESLERLRATGLARIARQALEAGDLERAVDAARAASDLDPLLESAAEVAIRAHLGRDDLDSALLEFDRYRDAMSSGLGVPPSRSILELIEPVPTESDTAVDTPDEDVPETVPAARPAGPAPAVRRSNGGRAVVRLLGVAALILVAALAVAGVDPPRDGGHTGASNRAASSDTAASSDAGPSGDTGGSGATVQPAMRVLPAGRAIRPGQLDVRLVDVADGRAAFLLRTTVQPMPVRLEVRGDAGRSIVRSVVVRSPQGHRLELSGLQPGIYQWLATSSVASAVSGQLRIPGPPVAVGSTDTVEAGGALPTVATAPAPQPSSDSPQPHPTPRPHPSGPPKDPGTRPLTPVG